MLGGDAKPTRAPRETRKGKSVAKERVERDEEDLVRLYLTDIGQYPLLTKDDEVRLAQAIEGIDREAAPRQPAPHQGRKPLIVLDKQDPHARFRPVTIDHTRFSPWR